MVESRWWRRIGPGVLAVTAVGAIATTTIGAAERDWSPPTCAGSRAALALAVDRPLPASVVDLPAEAWYRLDPLLDAAGSLRGQRLVVGIGERRAGPPAVLPRESFVAGPFGRFLLVGRDDGATSRLDAYDGAAGCSWPVATEREVIRRATLDPADGTVYETRVARVDRADLGVWRRSTDGSTGAERILVPLPADERFGRTFSTELTWSIDGDRLAVQACGEVACRTRLLSIGEGTVTSVADPELGLLIGVAKDRMVSHAACRGLPCPIESLDLASGTRTELESAAGTAAIVTTTGGPRLVAEVRDETGRRLRSHALDGTGRLDAGPVPDDLSLLAPTAGGGAIRLPDGWVLLAVDGRLPDDGSPSRRLLRRIPDGLSVPVEEVLR
jgi:hypothetical protein